MYPCTEAYGCLHRVIAALASLVSKDGTLVVEYIDPTDGCIQQFGHLGLNPDLHRALYDRDHLIAALEENFAEVVPSIETREGRQLYIARKKQST
jgi:hypothetical protein